MTFQYRHTIYACYAGFVSQAAINMLAPLLFVTFRNQYGLSLADVSQLIVINFGMQLISDMVTARFADRHGYRKSAVLALALSSAGLVSLSILPKILPDAYMGLCIAVAFYGFGGGMLDVVLTPIVAYLPGDAKEGQLSLLNASYSWGQTIVVALSTLFLWNFGTERWQVLPVLWALLPLADLFFFLKVPIIEPQAEQKMMSVRELLQNRVFLLLLLLMFCTGATVLSMSQWSSLFAEQGLRVPKVVGDLLGTCLFTGLTAVGRTLYGFFSKRMNLLRTLLAGGMLGILGYLITALAPWPLLSLLGCAACGFVTCLMWPGNVAMGVKRFPQGGTVMFALLALLGDLGSTFGPWLVGQISDYTQKLPLLADLAGRRGESLEQTALKAGLLVAMVFPIVLAGGLVILRRGDRRTQEQ